MNHWHKMEIQSWDRTDYWGDEIGVWLRPPQLRYEAVREEIQIDLDHAFRYGGTNKGDRDFAHAWRAGTENPPDTVIYYYTNKILTVFGCDNECPRNAQVVADDWADSMGRKAPRLSVRHLVSSADRPWPQDFKRLFDAAEPVVVRAARRRRR